MIRGLDPVVDPSTRTLIIGPFPNAASLAAGAYYAHPRDRFWRVMASALSHPGLLDLPYEHRLASLARNNIGLWDLHAQIDERSARSYCAAVPNQLLAFVADYGKINRIVENGQRAAIDSATYHRLGRMGIKVFSVPSTSGANTLWSLDGLVRRWRYALGLADDDWIPSE